MAYYAPEDLVRNHQLKPLSDVTISEINSIKTHGEAFLGCLGALAQSADMTLAKRKVEEAVMWATKAITA